MSPKLSSTAKASPCLRLRRARSTREVCVSISYSDQTFGSLPSEFAIGARSRAASVMSSVPVQKASVRRLACELRLESTRRSFPSDPEQRRKRALPVSVVALEDACLTAAFWLKGDGHPPAVYAATR